MIMEGFPLGKFIVLGWGISDKGGMKLKATRMFGRFDHQPTLGPGATWSQDVLGKQGGITVDRKGKLLALL